MAKPYTGWIRLHRIIKDHWLWPGVKGRRFSKFEAWLYLLLSANHQARKVDIGSRLITIERGQLLTSQVALGRKWSWHRETVLQFLYQLKADEMLDIETSKHTSTGYTLLSIRNYSKYQDIEGRASDIQSDIQSSIQPTSDRHPTDTNKNDKNEKKEEEEGYEFHRNSPSHAPQPEPTGGNGTGVGSNGNGWGKRDWIPFFLHNQNYVPGFPAEPFLNPQWWNNLFDQYPKQIGPGTLERTFAFMGRHFIEKPHKKPKTTRGYLQKTANIIRIQLEKDERANGDRTDMSWLDPQSDFMRKYFSKRSQGEGS